MSKATKSVFTEKLDDLDDFFPAAINKPEDSARASEAPAPASTPAPASAHPAPVAAEAEAEAPAAVRPARRRRVAVSPPTAEVAPEVLKALQKLTSREKMRDPITARTYAAVVLDAIDANQDKLSVFWTQPVASRPGGGLFSRQAPPMRRRRHAEPTGRVPLTGLTPDDAATLDNLITQWKAPSRSALVEQALRLYEPLWPAQRRGKRGSGDASDDDAADEN